MNTKTWAGVVLLLLAAACGGVELEPDEQDSYESGPTGGRVTVSQTGRSVTTAVQNIIGDYAPVNIDDGVIGGPVTLGRVADQPDGNDGVFLSIGQTQVFSMAENLVPAGAYVNTTSACLGFRSTGFLADTVTVRVGFQNDVGGIYWTTNRTQGTGSIQLACYPVAPVGVYQPAYQPKLLVQVVSGSPGVRAFLGYAYGAAQYTYAPSGPYMFSQYGGFGGVPYADNGNRVETDWNVNNCIGGATYDTEVSVTGAGGSYLNYSSLCPNYTNERLLLPSVGTPHLALRTSYVDPADGNTSPVVTIAEGFLDRPQNFSLTYTGSGTSSDMTWDLVAGATCYAYAFCAPPCNATQGVWSNRLSLLDETDNTVTISAQPDRPYHIFAGTESAGQCTPFSLPSNEDMR